MIQDYWPDDHTLVTADVNWVPDDYDAEGGTVKCGSSPVIENLHVHVFINGIQFDVTKAFDDKWIKHFTEKFKEYVIELEGAA
jgi:hypothetical protein